MIVPHTAFEAIPSDFKEVFGNVKSHDAFYLFLQNVYRLYPEDRFHTLIKEQTALLPNDEAIYRNVQRSLSSIKPFLADLTYALPALSKQKREMSRQTRDLLDGHAGFADGAINGYVEIGSTGRYISQLRKDMAFKGTITLVSETAPSLSPVDLVERGALAKIGQWIPLDDYAPMTGLAAGQADLVTCYIGLHHCPLNRLDAFLRSTVSAIRRGGVFVLRDHDVKTASMNAFVGLAHTVFNAGLNAPWAENAKELRFFRPVDEWIRLLNDYGLRFMGKRLLQAHDPSDNVLMGFEKVID